MGNINLFFVFIIMLINSPQEMIKFWKKLSLEYKKISIYWDLGAWKTHFAKWFAKWLWIKKNEVHSPTYTYLNIYKEKILHLDMYRIEKIEELIEKWIIEEMQNYDYLLIERPKFEQYWEEDTKRIQIKKETKTTREIIFLN